MPNEIDPSELASITGGAGIGPQLPQVAPGAVSHVTPSIVAVGHAKGTTYWSQGAAHPTGAMFSNRRL